MSRVRCVRTQRGRMRWARAALVAVEVAVQRLRDLGKNLCRHDRLLECVAADQRYRAAWRGNRATLYLCSDYQHWTDTLRLSLPNALLTVTGDWKVLPRLH